MSRKGKVARLRTFLVLDRMTAEASELTSHVYLATCVTRNSWMSTLGPDLHLDTDIALHTHNSSFPAISPHISAAPVSEAYPYHPLNLVPRDRETEVEPASKAPSENMHLAAMALEDMAFGRIENTHRGGAGSGEGPHGLADDHYEQGAFGVQHWSSFLLRLSNFESRSQCLRCQLSHTRTLNKVRAHGARHDVLHTGQSRRIARPPMIRWERLGR